MATPKGQRIGIIIIAVVMVVGTIGAFAGMVLGVQNQAVEGEQGQLAYDKYQTEVETQSKELSDKYYPILAKYKDMPAKFGRDSVKKLATKDLMVGEGGKISADTEYAAYYIGWNIDGKVFDQSIEGSALKAPLDPSMGLIEGWGKGVEGMKLGGVRLISIPSDLAYGETGSGDEIPPNAPIKFIVLAIEKPKEIEQPADLIMGGN